MILVRKEKGKKFTLPYRNMPSLSKRTIKKTHASSGISPLFTFLPGEDDSSDESDGEPSRIGACVSGDNPLAAEEEEEEIVLELFFRRCWPCSVPEKVLPRDGGRSSWPSTGVVPREGVE